MKHFNQKVKEFANEVLEVEETAADSKSKLQDKLQVLVLCMLASFSMIVGIMAFGNESWLPSRLAQRTEVWRADVHYHLPNVTPDSWENISITPHGQE